MATDGELSVEPVDDGEWVLFWTVLLLVAYVAVIGGVTALVVLL